MITRIRAAILILFFSISFICVPVCADYAYFSETYPRPITEMENVISQWLIRSDFKIFRTDREYSHSQVRLSAESREEVWEIGLSQQSSLETKVTIRKESGDAINPNRLNRLQDHISKYLKLSCTEAQDEWKESPPVNQNQSNRSKNHIAKYDKAPADKASDMHQKVPDTVLNQKKSLVCIKARVAGEVYQASGFIIDKNGQIICTAHDFRGFEAISIMLYDGREIPGRVLRMDIPRDLALVYVDEKLDHSIEWYKGRDILEMEELKIGEMVYSMGCPIILKEIVSCGLVTARVIVNDLPLLQIRMQIQHGSSGSPVFDEDGNLVGIVTGRHRERDSVGFLIPFKTLLEFYQEM